MVAVRKAVVLAAGFGTRLRPFTCTVPKALMPVWGEPMLARAVDLLRERGIDDITVNAHSCAAQIREWCGRNGCRCSCETEILGTGGALNPLREWLGDDDFYLVNGDVVLADLPELVRAPGDLGTCLATDAGPRTIEVEPASGYVTCWRSPDSGCHGTWTYCGVARLSAKVLRYVEPQGFSSIIQAYERAAADGLFMRAETVADLPWTDAGTIDDYLAVNTSGGENAFAAIPHLRAAGLADPVEFLGARGSDRCFFRAGDAVAVIYDAAARGENARYAGHARFLREHGIRVPEVRADLPDLQTQVFAYAGGTDLAAYVREKPHTVLTAYAPVVEEMAKLHALAGEAQRALELEPPFDGELYAWERRLFAEQLLAGRFRRELPDAVAWELEQVAARLSGARQVLLHRDFQSSNVIFRNDEFSLIDFQGMRIGPAAYDLASLLYDPYVEIGERDRLALAELYVQRSGDREAASMLPAAAVERMVQALGAFARLSAAGKQEFARHIVRGLENLLAAADEANLEATGALAEDLLAAEGARR